MYARNSTTAALALLLAASGGARCDDSSASIDTGALNFVVSTDVSMSKEDLALSVEHVQVRYRFDNKSKQDVETLVAFPLPDIGTGEDGNYAIESPDPVNFVNFEVAADGRKISPNVQVSSTSLGVDVTALLSKYNLPPTTIFADDDAKQKFYESLRNLPEPALAELKRYGAIALGTGSAGERADVNPQWTTSITFYWMQEFPAGKSVEITHAYRPVPRDFFTSAEELAAPALVRKYCPDHAFLAAARAWEKQGSLKGTEVRFVLTTGRNWLGPIGRFGLTFDKLDPHAIVATCFKGLRKTGETTFAASRENFSPDEDLGFLVLSLVKPE